MQEAFIQSSLEACKELFYLLQNAPSQNLYELSQEGFGGDISAEVDLLAEQLFIKKLSKFGRIISEEIGFVGSGEYDIIIDPIDGSKNFLSNFPYYGASIALKKGSQTLVGIICNLANGDIFLKTNTFFHRAKIYDLNFKNYHVHTHSKVGIVEKLDQSQNFLNKLIQNKIKFRSPGAIALSLAYAREVEFVAFMGVTRDFDVAAGMLMCQDLHCYIDEKTVIISKDSDVFKRLHRLYFEEK